MRWRKIERGRECCSGDTGGVLSSPESFRLGSLTGAVVVNLDRLVEMGSLSTGDPLRE
jgi:hypothetical protein